MTMSIIHPDRSTTINFQMNVFPSSLLSYGKRSGVVSSYIWIIPLTSDSLWGGCGGVCFEKTLYLRARGLSRLEVVDEWINVVDKVWRWNGLYEFLKSLFPFIGLRYNGARAFDSPEIRVLFRFHQSKLIIIELPSGFIGGLLLQSNYRFQMGEFLISKRVQTRLDMSIPTPHPIHECHWGSNGIEGLALAGCRRVMSDDLIEADLYMYLDIPHWTPSCKWWNRFYCPVWI